MTIITIMSMTMTMTEIGDPEIGIDHIVGDCETTTKITIKMIIETTIEMIIEMNIEMTIEKKIIGISKTRSIRQCIEIFMKIHVKTGTRRIEIVTKAKIKTKTDTEMTAMTELEVDLKRKIAHMMIEKNALHTKLESVQNFTIDGSRKRNDNRIYVNRF